ncbi:AtuA-related protein [Hathewaya massiliensis]|uniref:AtuA-related protein n=1 Tax=Hathewaya massiliensis TaxID=1964382 RepID=UPI0011570690|nr:hypothetical protein [Hathewaya massiliensis]
MKLKKIAHARTGDKGNMSNISVIPYDEKDYALLKKFLTEKRISEFFSEICLGEVKIYTLDNISAFNIVLENSLGGGVTRSLAIDRHGKSLGMALMEIDIDEN